MLRKIFIITTLLLSLSLNAEKRRLMVDVSTGECNQSVNFVATTKINNVTLQLNKWDATTAPTANEDSGDGYGAGSLWVDVINNKSYICLDSTLTAAVWTEITQASGTGDVVGPSSATDNAITRYNLTTGKLIQNSSATIDDSGSINIPSGQSYKIDGSALAKSDIGLGNVENTAVSTWPGSANITTLGTVTTGTLGTGSTIAGVTMSLGSDANYDIYYYYNGVLTRLPIGSVGQYLRVNSGGALAYETAGGSTDSDAIHDNTASEISVITEKASPVDADMIIIEDSADSNNKKMVQLGNIDANDSTAIHDNIAGEITAVAEKTTPVGNDELLIEDSADSDNKKSIKISNLFKQYKYISISSGAYKPATTNGATVGDNETTTNAINYDSYDFAGTSGSADEIIWLTWIPPKNWNAGTIKLKIFWEPATGASASDYVRWSVSALAVGNDDAIDTAPGTAVNLDDQVIAVGDMHDTGASSAITISNTPAVGDIVFIKIIRDYDYTGGGTGMSEDAKFIASELEFYTTDAERSGY